MGLGALAAQQDGVVSWAQARAHGETEGSVRAHLRMGRWTRVRHGAYLVHGVTTVREPWVQARAVTLTVPGVVVAGRSAAGLWGLAGVPDGAVEVAVPRARSLRTRSDLVVHRTTVDRAETLRLRGLLVTTAARTVQDLVLAHDRLVGLAVLDSALRTKLVRPGDLVGLRDGCRSRPGASATRDLWVLADGRAESPLESRVRLRCLDAGLVPDDLQLEIRDSRGGLCARVDLAFRTRRRPGRGLLLVEADGAAVHGSVDAVYRDRGRSNDLAGLGHDMLRFTYRDTVAALAIPRAIHAAL